MAAFSYKLPVYGVRISCNWFFCHFVLFEHSWRHQKYIWISMINFKYAFVFFETVIFDIRGSFAPRHRNTHADRRKSNTRNDTFKNTRLVKRSQRSIHEERCWSTAMSASGDHAAQLQFWGELCSYAPGCQRCVRLYFTMEDSRYDNEFVH